MLMPNNAFNADHSKAHALLFALRARSAGGLT
jgi:hypothetical protein